MTPRIWNWSAKLVCAAALCWCSGCSIIQPPESYMSLPRLPAEQEVLKETIEKTLPAGAVLVRPRTPNEYGTIPLVDLDGDGTKEAVAFYKEQQSGKIIGEIWKQEGAWHMQARLASDESFLEELSFLDLTNDGKLDIVVGYSLGSITQKGLTVYVNEGGNWTAKIKSAYSVWGAGDLNGDGKTDISIVNAKRGAGSTFTLQQYDGQLTTLGTVELASGVNDYYSMKVGNVAEGRQGAVMDASVGAHSSHTQLVVYEQGQLTVPITAEQTFKAYSGLSADADGDGIIEISGMKEPPGWGNEPLVSMPWILTYAKWDGAKGLKPALERYTSYKLGLYVDIPQEWGSDYTLELSDKEIRFVTASSEATAGGRRLLASIRQFAPEELDKEGQLPSGWQELIRTSQAVYGTDSEHAPAIAGRVHHITETRGGGDRE